MCGNWGQRVMVTILEKEQERNTFAIDHSGERCSLLSPACQSSEMHCRASAVHLHTAVLPIRPTHTHVTGPRSLHDFQAFRVSKPCGRSIHCDKKNSREFTAHTPTKHLENLERATRCRKQYFIMPVSINVIDGEAGRKTSAGRVKRVGRQCLRQRKLH